MTPPPDQLTATLDPVEAPKACSSLKSITTEPAPAAAADLAWPKARRFRWVMLLSLAIFAYGSGFARELTAPGNNIADFFQEWASAKNYFTGRAIYTPQRETALAYLNYSARPQDFFVEINGHPPTAVIIALPFGLLSYGSAFLLWNWLSVAALTASVILILRETGIRFSRWAILPALTLAIGNPLLQHIACGQLGTFLLLLITLAWVADRRGYTATAGALLAIATAVKLFPGFLFLFFVLKGKWRAVVAGGLTFVAAIGLTLAILGPQAFEDYVKYAMPEVGKYRRTWANASLDGFWIRTLSAESDRTIPLVAGRVLPRVAYAVSAVIAVGVTCLVVRRSRTKESNDLAFGLQLVAMLLVSPITWDHYFLLLTLPTILVVHHLAITDRLRVLLAPTMFILWLNPLFMWTLFLGATLINVFTLSCSATMNLVVVSLPCYALVTMFGLTAITARRTIAADITGAR